MIDTIQPNGPNDWVAILLIMIVVLCSFFVGYLVSIEVMIYRSRARIERMRKRLSDMFAREMREAIEEDKKTPDDFKCSSCNYTWKKNNFGKCPACLQVGVVPLPETAVEGPNGGFPSGCGRSGLNKPDIKRSEGVCCPPGVRTAERGLEGSQGLSGASKEDE